MGTQPNSTPMTAKRRVVVRVLAEKEQLAAQMVAATQAEVPWYSTTSATTIGRTTLALLDLLLGALRDERQLTPDDVAFFREYGETRARQGVPLIDMQRAWRIAVKDLLFALTNAGRRTRTRDGVLLELTNEVLEVIDQAINAYTVGHRDVEVELARRDQQERADFTRGVLLGTLSPAEIRMRAAQFGLHADHDYRAYRARSNWRTSVSWLTTIDGDVAGLVDAAVPVETTVTVGVGPPRPLDDLATSFRLAGRALTTAETHGFDGPSDVGALGLLLTVVSDPDLGAELARRYLDPVPDSDRTLLDTVEHYLDNAGIDDTARALVVHPNTVRYRLARYEELTGVNLRTPHQARETWWAIKYRRAT